MGWGSAGAGGWAGGGSAVGCDPGVVINARAERWAVERARERGGDVAELEQAAQAAESAAWRWGQPPSAHGTLGDVAAESAAWRREQERAADERGQLGVYIEVYGRAPAGPVGSRI